MLNPTRILGLIALACAPALMAQQLVAQEQGPPPLPPELGGPDPQSEMFELFARVERNLRAIDDMLYSASAGEAPLENAAESGLGDLLRNSIEQGDRVLEDIDRILEIAEQQQSSSSSSSQSQSSEPSSGSPGQQSQGEQGRREATPETPDQVEQSPEGQGENQQQPEPQPSDPQSGNPNDPDPANRVGREPGSDPTERIRVLDDVERWGELPVHVREIFSSEGGGHDMPAQYRDWIDSYYRRLSRTTGS